MTTEPPPLLALALVWGVLLLAWWTVKRDLEAGPPNDKKPPKKR